MNNDCTHLVLDALLGRPTRRVPVWMMRQAGRYMAEYRAVREKISFLELCENPRLCAEVMATAVERLGVDAAILFSDLLPMLRPMGFQLEYTLGDGPVIGNPFRERADLSRVVAPEDLSPLAFVFEAVRETRRVIPKEIPLIGFAGAPFTLAGYVVEGGTSRNFHATKRLMWSQPDVWNELLARLVRVTAGYLNRQIHAGADAVQLFDSWAGVLGQADYRRYVLPHVNNLIAAISPGVPVIYFGTGNPALLPAFGETAASCIGVDWRIELSAAREILGKNRPVQGNLDPAVLLTNESVIRHEVVRILETLDDTCGVIFNLGHGILKETPVENVLAAVQAVKSYRQKDGPSR